MKVGSCMSRKEYALTLLKREDYKAIKRMDKKQMEEYLKRVYMRGYEAGRRSLSEKNG